MEEFLHYKIDLSSEANTNEAIENLENGELILKFTIPGRPSTKKTSQRIVRRGKFSKILPSVLYEKYELHCQQYCESFWKKHKLDPIDCGISIKLKVYLNTYVIGDECGYAQAHGDIIQKHGIIADDIWIHWLDNGDHMISIDKDNPRVEVEIKRFKHPKEDLRNEQRIKEAKKKAKVK